MNIERPGSPSATIVAPTSKRRSTSIETKRSRLASERPPKKGVASKNAFRSGELTAIDLIYSRSQRRQAGQARRNVSTINTCAGVSGCRSSPWGGLVPSRQPGIHAMIVNLQTAKLLEIEIPATLLARADRVIE